MGSLSREYIKDNFTYKNNGQLITDKYKEIIDGLF
jgi:hypothetical protein